MKLKNVKKSVDENVLSKNGVLALDDKSITKLTDITDDFARFSHLTSLILAHNRLSSLTQGKNYIFTPSETIVQQLASYRTWKS